jgi:hypothetical protein
LQLLEAWIRHSTRIHGCIIDDQAMVQQRNVQPTPIIPLCRVYALLVTERVCAEPLTNAVHFNGLLHANPQHVEASARLLKSLALAANKLYSEMQLLREQQAPMQRSDRLTLGVPYPLQDTLR